MKEKLLALLIAAFSGARKDVLSHLASALALQVTTEEEAKALVEKLTKEQVESFSKDLRASVDKEISDSNKTFEQTLKNKYDFVEKGKTDPKPNQQNTGNNDDIATIVANAVAEAVKPFKEQLDKYEKRGIEKTRLQILEQKLSTCKDETFKTQTLKDFARMNFSSDEDFNEYLSAKETDIATANQSISNNRLSSHSRPFVSRKDDEAQATKEELDNVMSRMPI